MISFDPLVIQLRYSCGQSKAALGVLGLNKNAPLLNQVSLFQRHIYCIETFPTSENINIRKLTNAALHGEWCITIMTIILRTNQLALHICSAPAAVSVSHTCHCADGLTLVLQPVRAAPISVWISQISHCSPASRTRSQNNHR